MSEDPRQLGYKLDYSRPFGWWGPHLQRPDPRSLPRLVEQELLPVRSAAFLSLAMQCRRSIIVAAEPPQAGKTTTLTALVDFLPKDTDRIYIRGVYERFTFVDEIPAAKAYILCNEISAHLPAYLWGGGVRRLFDALDAGYPLATTMHASSGADAINQLLNFPLEVPEGQVAKLDLVVTLGAGYVDNRFVRRLVAIDLITQRNGSVVLESLAERDPLRASSQLHVGRMVRALALWMATTDEIASNRLALRERRIQDWVQHGTLEPEAVRSAIAMELGNS